MPGTPGSYATAGPPGGLVGDGGVRAEGAPKLGPLPPGARNATVPIPHTTPPTSGPVHQRQPNPGGPGPGGPGGHNGPGGPGGGPGGPGGPIGGNTGSFPRPQNLPPQPARRNGPRNFILALVAVLTVGVLALCALAGVFVLTDSDEEPRAASRSAASGAPAPEPSRNAEQPSDDDLPAFKKALPVIVTGAVFDPGEQTDLIQRPAWPFAFRVPVGWLCDDTLVVDGPNNEGLECRPPGRANDALVRVGFRDCGNPCDETTQKMMSRDIASGSLIEGDATTDYAELANPKDNVYSLFVSHFFGTVPGEPLRWQVVVQGSSPHTDRAAIQKVANDIRTQTP